MQIQVCARDTETCLFGSHPTLERLSWYGKNMPKAWLLIQLTDLSEYCGCKDKLQGKPLEQCAEIIACRYGSLKVTELMLFFYRIKAGDYGRFYGSIDPLIITSMLKSFIEDRNILIEKYQQKMREKKEKEDRENSITYDEWQKLKQQYANEQ